MTTDFRALCAELYSAVQLYTGQNPASAETPSNQLVRQLMDAMAATAAALAQPEPVGPLEVETTYGSEHAAAAQQILDGRMVVEGTFEHGGETYRFKAKPEREAAMDELRAASAEARPAVAGLMERLGEQGYGKTHARAAIREVAAAAKDLRFTTAKALIAWLEREADRG